VVLTAAAMAVVVAPSGPTTAVAAPTATHSLSAPSVHAHLAQGATPLRRSGPLAGKAQLAKRPSATTPTQPRTLSGPGAATGLHAYGPIGIINVPLSSDTLSVAITPSGNGAWTLQTDGSVKPTGDAVFEGDGVGLQGCGDYVGIASTGTGSGYWLATSWGCVVTAGDATFYGDASSTSSGFIQAIRATPDHKGYYLVDDLGALFTYGDAHSEGDTSGLRLNRAIVSMAITPTNNGYWFVANDGGIFTFGDALYRGSAGNISTNGPILDMAATSDGGGYWLTSAGGTVYPFGNAGTTFGDQTGTLTSSIAATSDNGGYWLAGFDGSIGHFGDATALTGDTQYVMGSFAGTQSTSTASDFSATIDWGDGSSSGGTVDGIGNYVVTGRHTYARASYWHATVHVTDTAGDNLSATAIGFTLPTSGYWMVATDGGIFTFGQLSFFGSTGNIRLNEPIVGMAATPTHLGYWMVASDGGIFSFGDAHFWGSTGAIHLNQPIVGMAPTSDGRGYWLVASDGGIFTFGTAKFFGSTGSIHLNQPIVGMAATWDGGGYWLVARDGGIFTFGDATYHDNGVGATSNGKPVTTPWVGMAATVDGGGYWLVNQTGVLALGDAADFSSAGIGQTLNAPLVGMTPREFDQGFYADASDGGIFTYGDAPFLGSMGAVRLNKPVVGMAGL
jgi:hypothetical protein